MKKYLSKDRFSLQQVVVMLTLAFVSMSVLAYAAVNIPYTFTSGTPARAAEVNANFQAVANAMPAIKTTFLPYSGDIDTAGIVIHSLQVTPPAPGKMLISATGTACIYGHTGGVMDGFRIYFLNSSSISWDNAEAGGTDLPTQSYIVSAATPTFSVAGDRVCMPYHLTGVVTLPSTDPITFTLRAQGSSAPFFARLNGNTLTAQYFPNALL